MKMSEAVKFSVYAESHYLQRNEKTGQVVSFRIVGNSLLPKIKATQSRETYEYAIRLFDELKRREKEVEKAQQEVIAVNKILLCLLNKTVNMEDRS